MNSYLSHDTLMRRFKVYGRLRTDDRIHIGTGDYGDMVFEDADSLQIKITKDGLEFPYIPGSSLKGVFRSSVEGILHSVNKNVCLLQRNSKCFNLRKTLGNLSRNHNKAKIIKKLRDLCFACKIFGGHGYASHVFFSESYPLSKDSVSFDISPGIAINRIDGTTMRRALFSFEHINPNSEFSFEIRIKNLPNFLFGILMQVIYLINRGVILIGGKKRAGLGKVFIILDGLTFEQFAINTSAQKNDSHKINLEFERIGEISQKGIKIEKLQEVGVGDVDILIPISELKGKNEEDFSNNLIKYTMEAWKRYATSS